MPNWASVTYKVTGNKEQITKLHEAIQELETMDKPLVENGFGNLWLGCLVNKLGGDWNKVYCRGQIIGYCYCIDEDGVLVIDQDCAWGEMNEVREFLYQVFDGITIYYKNEECGMCSYYHNDSSGDYFPERYLLDGYDVYEYFSEIEEAAAYVADIVGHPVEPTTTAICEALDDYQQQKEEEGEDVFFSFHEFEVTDD